MHKRIRIYLLIGMALVTAAASVHAASDLDDEWEHNYTIQALLGGVKYADLEFTSSDGTDTTTIDMTTLPQLGGAWSTKPKGEKVQLGLETSFLLGFRVDEIRYAYAGGGGAYVNISTSMWMIDFAGGGYANIPLGEKLRLYGAAGPLMMIVDYRSKREYTDATPNSSDSETSFGLGVYARTGLELKIQPQGYLGVGIRGNWSSVDFGDVGGNSDISGIAAFITYTAGL